MKKIDSACVSVALVFTLAGFFSGCSKSEQPKEVLKPVEQQAAPAAPATAAVPSAAGSIIAEFTFEDGTQKWASYQKGLSFTQNMTENHGGKASLEISGTSNSGIWNFGGTPRLQLESGKHYRLSAWMKVMSYESSNEKLECFLKMGIYKDNKNIRVIGKQYNLAQKGTWQLISVEFNAPADNNLSGSISIGKNMDTEKVITSIYIDDIKIEKTN